MFSRSSVLAAIASVCIATSTSSAAGLFEAQASAYQDGTTQSPIYQSSASAPIIATQASGLAGHGSSVSTSDSGTSGSITLWAAFMAQTPANGDQGSIGWRAATYSRLTDQVIINAPGRLGQSGTLLIAMPQYSLLTAGATNAVGPAPNDALASARIEVGPSEQFYAQEQWIGNAEHHSYLVTTPTSVGFLFGVPFTIKMESTAGGHALGGYNDPSVVFSDAQGTAAVAWGGIVSIRDMFGTQIDTFLPGTMPGDASGSVAYVGSSVGLDYTRSYQVPEPATFLLVGLIIAGGLQRVRSAA